MGLPLPGQVDCRPKCELEAEFRVLLSAKAAQQLFSYCYAIDDEITLFGSVEQDKEDDDFVYIIEEFFLLEQTGSGGHTTVTPEAMAKFMEELRANGKKDAISKIKCWVHTHPGGMGTFWSQTDDNTGKLLSANPMICIVVSDNFKVKCRINCSGPIPLSVDDVPVFFKCFDNDSELVEACKKEVEEKVKRTSHSAVSSMECVGRRWCVSGGEIDGWEGDHNVPLLFRLAYNDFISEPAETRKKEVKRTLCLPDDDIYGWGGDCNFWGDGTDNSPTTDENDFGVRGANLVVDSVGESVEFCLVCGNHHEPGNCDAVKALCDVCAEGGSAGEDRKSCRPTRHVKGEEISDD